MLLKNTIRLIRLRKSAKTVRQSVLVDVKQVCHNLVDYAPVKAFLKEVRANLLSVGFVGYFLGFDKLFGKFVGKFQLKIVVDFITNDVFDKVFVNAFFGGEFVDDFSNAIARFVEKQKGVHILLVVNIAITFCLVNGKIDFDFVEAFVVKFVLALLLRTSRACKILHKRFVRLVCSFFI